MDAPALPPTPPSHPADWIALSPDEIRIGRSFISGQPEGERLRIQYFRRVEDGCLVGKAWFGPESEGPPGHAHGGSISGVLDEAMGIAAWLAGHPVVAARLSVNFIAMVPLGTQATFEAQIASVDGRKVKTHATLRQPNGEPFATAEGLFITVSPEQLQAFAATVRERNAAAPSEAGALWAMNPQAPAVESKPNWPERT